MATEQKLFSVGREVAAADLSSSQFFCAKIGASGVGLTSAQGEICDGVIQNKPVAGEPVSLCVHGITKVVASAALAKGSLVTVGTTGKVEAAASGDYVLGRLLEAATADGDIVTMLILRAGRIA